MHIRSIHLIRSSAMVAASLLAASSHAALISWDGLTNGNWAEPTNWTTDVGPVDGDSLSFGTTTGTRVTNNDISNLLVAGINIPGNAYTLAGNAIRLDGDVAFSAGAGNQATISLVSNLQRDLTINVAANTGSGRLQWAGDIAGNFNVTKDGAGVMRLTGASAFTYTGTTTITAGTLTVAGSGALPNGVGKGNVSVGASGTLTTDNAAFTINGLNGSGVLSKTGSNSRTITVGGGDANGSFSGTVSFTGGTGNGLAKTGLGTQVFSGNSATLPGSLLANGGLLVVDGAWGTVVTTVGASGSLGGTGSLNNVTVNGKLTPGGSLSGNVTSDSRAVLATVNLILTSTTSTTIEIDGVTRETLYDGLDVSGALTYGGALSLDFGAAAAGGVYDLFAFGATIPAGSFASVSVVGSHAATLTNNGSGIWTGSSGGTSFSFSQSSGDLTVVVPEPASLAALAAAGVVLRRRR